MSEQKLSYMQELDAWSDANVLDPLILDSEEYVFFHADLDRLHHLGLRSQRP